MPSIVVTGAARGIGYAFLQFYSQQGWTVFGLVRRNKADVEAKLSKEGIKNVTIIEADVGDVPALQKAAEQVSKATEGTLDVLINNAAIIGERCRWRNIDQYETKIVDEELTDTFRVNVIGVAFVTNIFLPFVRAGSTKKIITMSSGLAEIEATNGLGLAAGAPYAISKAAVNMLVAKYNAAYGKSEGILFLSLSPGLVETGMNEPQDEEAIKGFQAMAAQFKVLAPDFTGPIKSEESVKMMDEVITNATVESMGGQMFSHHGDKNWL